MKYSVIIPCYNVTKFLKRCLDCIFATRYTDLEIILVNDGSTDDLGGACGEYFSTDICESNMEFLYMGVLIKMIHQKNEGVSSARNRGINESIGEYIIFIDPDDYISETAFTVADSCIRDSDKADLIILGFTRIDMDSNGRCMKKKTYMPLASHYAQTNKEAVNNILPYYFGKSVENMIRYGKGISFSKQGEFGSVWRCIYRGELVRDKGVRFNPQIKLNEDSMFIAECISLSNRIVSFDKSYYFYISRNTGALVTLMSNDTGGLVDNKLALLEERGRIAQSLRDKGYELTVADYAGSNFLSCVELIVKCDKWKSIEGYITHPVVRESIKMMPCICIRKVDLACFLLKLHMGRIMFLGVKAGKKFGISFDI